MTEETAVRVEAPEKRRFFRDLSVSATVAGFIAIVVGYSSSGVIIFSAAQAGGLTDGQTTSWIWAASLSCGLTSAVLSLWTRIPVITAWSTPGAAILVTSLADYSYAEAIGAYIVAAVIMTAVGVSGVFGKLMALIPQGVVSAMLAGILFSFGVKAFGALDTTPAVVIAVLVGYVVTKAISPRYAVLAGLVLGVATAAVAGDLSAPDIPWNLAKPEFTTPHFSVAAIVGIGFPMFLVSLTSQNAPGLAVLQSSGYKPDDRLLIGSTGFVTLLFAPFGGHSTTLAAITAAICTGPEAHPDKRRRYTAGVMCGVFYTVIGFFGPALIALLAGLPKDLIAVIAGVALLGALTNGLAGAMQEPKDREAALVTFLVTASGVTLLTIASAFWGLVFGMAVHLVSTGAAKLKTRREAKTG